MAAGDYASFGDYLSQFEGLNPSQAAASDIPAAASLSSLLPALSTAGPYLAGIAALAELGFNLGDIFGGGRASTGPGSATSDIASASSNMDPVIALLGRGAGGLGGNTPVSSPAAGSTYGPYFDAARRLEDLVRWGPGGLTDPKAEALDATTLKNAMHELGNPGKTNDSTLNALMQAYSQGQRYLTPQNLTTLLSQENPQEQQITGNILNTPGGGGGNTLNIPGGSGGNTTTAQTGGLSNNPFNLGNQSSNILNLAQLAPLMALLSGGGPRFGMGWTVA